MSKARIWKEDRGDEFVWHLVCPDHRKFVEYHERSWVRYPYCDCESYRTWHMAVFWFLAMQPMKWEDEL